jgi:hypothetical protein
MSDPARRELSSVPNWLTGIIIRRGFGGNPRHERDELRCRQCDELLCVVDQDDSLWVLADVARDHRTFCRDKEER